MLRDLKLDGQTQAIIMATGGAAVAAIAAMFVPVGLWETLTGATGISEMIPATGAPLGDTARALIAFAFGALTFAILAVLLLRRAASPRVAIAADEFQPQQRDIDDDGDDGFERSSLVSRLRDRVSAFVDARRGGDGITDLEDLPKLRSGDAHPDAPPRRPLLATRDLADPEPDTADAAIAQSSAAKAGSTDTSVEPGRVDAAEPTSNFIESAQLPAAAQAEADDAAEITGTAADRDAADPSVDLHMMVTRLETALDQRAAKLARLEALTAQLRGGNVQPIREPAPVAAETMSPRPALEAVETATSEAKPEADELDAALRSALETLHRMNARTR